MWSLSQPSCRRFYWNSMRENEANNPIFALIVALLVFTTNIFSNNLPNYSASKSYIFVVSCRNWLCSFTINQLQLEIIFIKIARQRNFPLWKLALYLDDCRDGQFDDVQNEVLASTFLEGSANATVKFVIQVKESLIRNALEVRAGSSLREPRLSTGIVSSLQLCPGTAPVSTQNKSIYSWKENTKIMTTLSPLLQGSWK